MQQTGQRIAWIDCAKGATILLILLHHAVSYESALFGQSGAQLVLNWRNIDLFLYHVRLPLFFFLSGMAASGFLSGRSNQPNWRTVRGNGLLYGLWGLALLFIVPDWPNMGPTYSLSVDQVTGLALGGSVIWYLWAIALCLLAAHLTRAVPAWAVICAAFALHVVMEGLDNVPGHLPALARALPVYLIGFRWPRLATREGALPRGSVAAFALLAIAVELVGSNALFLALMDIVGLGVGLTVARNLPQWLPTVEAPLAWIGRRTLPIYILHFPIIAALGEGSLRLIGPLPLHHPLVAIYAPLLAAAAAGGSLALHLLLQRAGAGWLFKLGGSNRAFDVLEKAP